MSLAPLVASIRANAKNFGKFAVWTTIGRVAQVCAALLVVRVLSKDEYGWYNLATTAGGSLALFSLTGISSGLLPLVGAAAVDRKALGKVLVSALSLRLVLTGFGALVAIPFCAWMLVHTGCTFPSVILLLSGTMVATILSTNLQVIGTPLSVLRKYEVPQIEAVYSTGCRLVLLLVVSLMGWASAAVIMWVGVLSALPSLLFYLLPQTQEPVDWTQKADQEVRKRLWAHFVIGLPTSLTYLAETQIAAWIVAWFAGATAVADLGALGRLGLLFSVPLAMINGVLTPRMAGEENLHALHSIWRKATICAISVAVPVLGVGYAFREHILRVLGPAYQTLHSEFILYLGFQVFAFVVTTISAPIGARGWVKLAWIRPLVVFSCQAVMASCTDVGSVRGGVLLMWAGAIGNSITNAILLWQGWRGRGTI